MKIDLSNNTLSRATLEKYMQLVTPFLVDRRYCTACATERPASDFKKIKCGNSARWICGACQRRESDSWITRGRK